MATEKLRDIISDGDLKVYYTGEVSESLDKAIQDALVKEGYKFVGMTHARGFIHRMVFIKDEWIGEE